MTPTWKLSAAGFAATAVTFGPARMGFGLFVPEFRSAFSISSQAVGLLSSLGFVGFLVGLTVAQAMISRGGPRVPVLAGLAAATAGLGLVAAATGLPLLAAGVFLAMSSAGFTWVPFNDAAHRAVRDHRRPTVLSVVSTGTAVGMAAAGVAALVLSLGEVSWRICWLGFAAAGLAAFVANAPALGVVAQPAPPGPSHGWRPLFRRDAILPVAVGLSFGTTSALYLSFAADRVAQSGGLAGLPASAAPAVVFIALGAAGLAGLATGGIKAALGLPWLLRLLFAGSAVSLGLVALTPTSWPGVLASAALQGMAVMMTSAVLSFWSERLFPDLPARSFTGVLLAVAIGNALGPAAAGAVSEAFGATAMFLAAAAIPAVTALAITGRHTHERADETGQA